MTEVNKGPLVALSPGSVWDTYKEFPDDTYQHFKGWRFQMPTMPVGAIGASWSMTFRMTQIASDGTGTMNTSLFWAPVDNANLFPMREAIFVPHWSLPGEDDFAASWVSMTFPVGEIDGGGGFFPGAFDGGVSAVVMQRNAGTVPWDLFEMMGSTFSWFVEGPDLSQGAWPIRQRQSLTGTPSWPLRQRQNGASSGSWPLRQRQM